MTREELIAQLDAWHEEDEFQQIVDEINLIPTSFIDDELAVHLGRAYNNLGRYKDALKWFLKIDEEGRNNSLWHFRVGYAYYYLDQNEEAAKEFEIAHQMDPEDEDTLTFLEWSRNEAADQSEDN
ncbi:Tetratricopeptide repeat protein [compost metagenome]